MFVFICIDDTDDLTKATSTGKIAQLIEQELLRCGVVSNSEGITRHQLLLDNRIAYTSHNSSMCMKLTISQTANKTWPVLLNQLAEISRQITNAEKALDSDPGLCICSPDCTTKTNLLIQFGIDGQKKVLTKENAFTLAHETGVFLEELGGDGAGVIGALCGVGLRLSGYDGWFRGKINLDDYGISSEKVSAAELAEKLHLPVFIDGAQHLAAGDEMVDLSAGIKALLWKHQWAIVIKNIDNSDLYQACNKRSLSNSACLMAKSCDDFVFDNDEEEFASDCSRQTCFNCLYRRWTADTFTCVKDRL